MTEYMLDVEERTKEIYGSIKMSYCMKVYRGLRKQGFHPVPNTNGWLFDMSTFSLLDIKRRFLEDSLH